MGIRIESNRGESWYHLYAFTAATGRELFYARAYRLNIGAFCIMGNHSHYIDLYSCECCVKGACVRFFASSKESVGGRRFR
jgi:hypothetical protein